jgi:superfamily II DNA/RNA helicase
MEFNELKLEPGLLRGIADRGYKEMTAVQEQTLAQTMKERPKEKRH